MSNTSSLLANLLHVPNITRNLISVSNFSKDNKVYFEFYPNKCFVKSQASGQVLLEGFLDASGLYCFNNVKVESLKGNFQHKTFGVELITNNVIVSQNSLTIDKHDCTSLDKVYLWNSRLRHAHPKAIHKVLNLCNLHVKNKKTLDFCHSGCLGKAHKSFEPLSATKYTTLFELVHTDLWGPSFKHWILLLYFLFVCLFQVHLDLLTQLQD